MMDGKLSGGYNTLLAAIDLLAQKEQEKYSRRMSAIKRRMEDPYLNLAVIGDFSCGKSTFLNALLRRRLLSMNLQPTTAVPTYIRWQEHGLADFRLAATDQKQDTYDITGDDRDAFEQYAGIRLPDHKEQMIDAVTTNSRLISLLERVDIAFPHDARYHKICLIDTPGVNPGGNESKEHVRLTQRVLREEADAAIILFPAGQVFTASFQEFLEEHAAHLLDRSIFIVTMMDLVQEERDKQRLPWFVAEHLRNMGVEQPQVHCISAGKALNWYTDAGQCAENESWARDFEAVLETIFQDLARRREQIVQDSINAMLKDVMADVQLELAKRVRELEQTEAELDQYSAERMRQACQELVDQYLAELDQKTQMDYAIATEKLDAIFKPKKKEILEHVSACRNMVSLNRYIRKNFDTNIKDCYEQVLNELKDIRDRMNAGCLQLVSKMEECLAGFQIHLPNVNGRAIKLHAASYKVEEMKISTWDETTAFTVLDDLFNGVGDIIEALKDMSLSRIVGEVKWMFESLAGDVVDLLTPMETRKRQYRELLGGKIDKAQSEIEKQYIQQIQKMKKQYQMAAEKLLSKYESSYVGRFDEARSAFAGQKQKISADLNRYTGMIQLLKSLTQDSDKENMPN